MGALAPIKPKLLKLIPLLSSDRDGEVLATVRAIERMLLSAGLDWHELAGAVGAEPEVIEKVVYRNPPQPKPDWEAKLDSCIERRNRLSSREQDFLDSLDRGCWGGRTPTKKQLAWLIDIFTRIIRVESAETGL